MARSGCLGWKSPAESRGGAFGGLLGEGGQSLQNWGLGTELQKLNNFCYLTSTFMRICLDYTINLCSWRANLSKNADNGKAAIMTALRCAAVIYRNGWRGQL